MHCESYLAPPVNMNASAPQLNGVRRNQGVAGTHVMLLFKFITIKINKYVCILYVCVCVVHTCSMCVCVCDCVCVYVCDVCVSVCVCVVWLCVVCNLHLRVHVRT